MGGKGSGGHGPNRRIDRMELLAMRLDGATYRQIGAHMGASHQRAQEILRPEPDVVLSVKERANYTCERCGCALLTGGHIHHASYTVSVTVYNTAENLQWLCMACHGASHAHLRPPRIKKIQREKVIKLKPAGPIMLRMYRRLHEIPQQALAERLGVKQPTYLRYELGQQPIPDSHLAALAHLFKVPGAELVQPMIKWPKIVLEESVGPEASQIRLVK